MLQKVDGNPLSVNDITCPPKYPPTHLHLFRPKRGHVLYEFFNSIAVRADFGRDTSYIISTAEHVQYRLLAQAAGKPRGAASRRMLTGAARVCSAAAESEGLGKPGGAGARGLTREVVAEWKG
jgi:hypothetical protein